MSRSLIFKTALTGSVLTGGLILLAALRRTAAQHLSSSAKTSYKLHLYDHCPYCVRIELVLGIFNIPYERVVYNYGEGASSEKLGYNPEAGPVTLTGKKMLPVLSGPGVPLQPRLDGKPGMMEGMPESLDIISYLTTKHCLTLPCETSPGKLKKWKEKFGKYKSTLTRPRIINVPCKDWEKPEDIAYAQNKYKNMGFDYKKALMETDECLSEMNKLLVELEDLIEGETSIREWGVGLDDIVLLPDMKSLSAVKGIVWPSKVRKWVDSNFGKCSQCELYDKYAN